MYLEYTCVFSFFSAKGQSKYPSRFEKKSRQHGSKLLLTMAVFPRTLIHTVALVLTAVTAFAFAENIEVGEAAAWIVKSGTDSTSTVFDDGNGTWTTPHNNWTMDGGGTDWYNSSGGGLDDLHDNDDPSAESIVPRILKSMVLVSIIVLAIFSNLLVVLSVVRYHKLRHINNYFLVSLAVADLLVACFAMTFNATVEITGRWNFGYRICDLWNSLDVHFSTVSTLHLCCIAVDRYYAIVRPLKYTSYMTVKVAALMIGVAWTAPTLISFLPIFLGWYTTADHQKWRETHPNECIFRVNQPYAFISSTLTFWAPVSVMLIMYHRIYKEALRQKEAIRRSSVPSQQHLIVDSDSVRSKFQALQANGFRGFGKKRNSGTIDSKQKSGLSPPSMLMTSSVSVGNLQMKSDESSSAPSKAAKAENNKKPPIPALTVTDHQDINVTTSVVVTAPDPTTTTATDGTSAAPGTGPSSSACPTPVITTSSSSSPVRHASVCPATAAGPNTLSVGGGYTASRRLSMAASSLSEGKDILPLCLLNVPFF